jgi:hypothetical protein
MKKIFWLSLLLGIFACSNSNFPVYSKLDSLRVLVLVADKPEVNPGTTVTITPSISDTQGGGRVLQFSASACPDLGVGGGATATCVGNPLAVTIATNQNLTILNAASFYTGAVDTFTLNVPATALLGQSAINAYNGVSYLVTYQLSGSDGVVLTSSFKRIVVSQRLTLNQNPSLTAILADGLALTAVPSKTASFSAQIPAASAEKFTYQDSSGNLQSSFESLQVTWFSNSGDFQYVRTNYLDSNQWTPGGAPLGGHALFVGVVRDGRGGEAILEKNF